MIFLIDTTTNPTTIGLYDYKFTPSNVGDLKIRVVESNPENNKKLIGIINKFIGKSKLDAVGVINGPGTFTGVRTGVTIANTAAYALGLPLYSIDSLTAQVPRMITDVVSLISASNSEVFFARFENGKIQKGVYPDPNGRGIELVDTMNLHNRLNDGDIIVGDFQERHCGLITKQEFRAMNSTDRIKNLLDLILCKKIKPQKMVLPLYIKKPNITKKKKLS